MKSAVLVVELSISLKGHNVIKDKSILLWGNNLQLIGEEKNNTIIEKQGAAGWWGENIVICGKVNGGKYYGDFGNISYERFRI